jgi:uncharacterized FlaG/YvyC family protein
MSEIDPIAVSNLPVNGVKWGAPASAVATQEDGERLAKSKSPSALVEKEVLQTATLDVARIVNAVSDKALQFSIEEDLNRTVVAVRAVGSDEIIRQFPPEEFITVAKFLAAQEIDALDEDFLKGILFDQYS